MSITHAKVSAISDGGDSSLVQPSDWNADHVIPSGSWTPTIEFTSLGDLSVSYTTNSGAYTRIGDLVHVAWRITTSSFTYSTTSGNMRVTGLPYTSTSFSAQTGSLAFAGWDDAAFKDIVPVAIASSTSVRFLVSRSGSGIDEVAVADVASGGSVNMYASLIYYTS